MEQAIILAAGRGERLVNGLAFPKPLKRVAGVPLITRILRNLETAGIERVGVVVGYLQDVLMASLKRQTFNFDLQFIENDEWEKPNGTSLLKARAFVDRETFLLMADHLWSPDLLSAVRSFPMASDEAVLGVDYRIQDCFDIADATKVCVDGVQVQRIGKELRAYNALDTGVFRISPAFMEALAQAETIEGCSLSQGVASMSRQGKMRAADIGDAMWIDVDTPEAHAYAERTIARYGRILRPVARPLVAEAVAV